MFEGFRKWLAGAVAPKGAGVVAGFVDGSRWGERRWEAADTHRLNEAHWGRAQSSLINDDLAGKLSFLRMRSAYEAANNGFVRGIIETHCTDLIGERGPTLQVHCDDEDFSSSLEQVWNLWVQHCDVNGQLHLVDMLELAIRSCWVNGEYLRQKLSADSGRVRTLRGDEGLPTLRLHNVDPRRLNTPPGHVGDPEVVLGIRRTETGRPVSYFVEKPRQGMFQVLGSGEFSELRAEQVVHGYRMEEADQARGVPWLASVLQVIADVRDFQAETLDAARAAAEYSQYFWTEHPDIEPMQINSSETLEIERRTAKYVPPGWRPEQLQPGHPGPKYVEYIDERLREYGRPINMPLMMVKLDSSKHNYSSARFDAQRYDRTCSRFQRWLERVELQGLVMELAREAVLMELIKPAPVKGGIVLEFTWPKAPHVDPAKEAQAADVKLKNKTLSLKDALASEGKDLETHLTQLEKEAALLRAKGILVEEADEGGDSSASDEERMAERIEVLERQMREVAQNLGELVG